MWASTNSAAMDLFQNQKNVNLICESPLLRWLGFALTINMIGPSYWVDTNFQAWKLSWLPEPWFWSQFYSFVALSQRWEHLSYISVLWVITNISGFLLALANSYCSTHCFLPQTVIVHPKNSKKFIVNIGKLHIIHKLKIVKQQTNGANWQI